MIRYLTIWLFAVGLLTACAHSTPRSPANAGNGMLFSIQGTHAIRGPYRGELEIRTVENGVVEAVRLVSYENFRFEGYEVEEVWTGTGRITSNMVEIDFVLRRGDFLTRVGELKRSAEDFQKPLVVSYQLAPVEGKATLTLPSYDAQEQLALLDRRPGRDPLWRNLRRAEPSTGRSHEAIGVVAMATAFAPLQRRLHADPFVRQYANRTEFRSKQQAFITDPTDFEFLRSNPRKIRVANKVVDTISLLEARYRRDAYAPTLLEKAQSFDKDILGHLNEFGMFSAARLGSAGEIVSQAPNGDAGLWTGMYAGTQAMRWKVTGEAEALANFRKALHGLMMLLEVTGDPKEFGRTIERISPQERVAPPWHRAVAPHEQLKYLARGNNDMIKGIFHAFAWALEILPESDPARKLVIERIAQLSTLSVVNESKRVGNRYIAYALQAAASGDKNDLQKFLAVHGGPAMLLDALDADDGFHHGGIADWSGINLGMVGKITRILVAQQIARKFPARGTTEIVRTQRLGLLDFWGTYADGRRDFLTTAAATFGRDLGNELHFPAGSRPTSWKQQGQWAEAFRKAIWSLREVPVFGRFHDVTYDYSKNPDWCVSAWPRLPWKTFSKESRIDYFLQGAYQYPFFEGQALWSDNLWKDVFTYQGGASKSAKQGRVDYLYMYWMARLGFLLDQRGRWSEPQLRD